MKWSRTLAALLALSLVASGASAQGGSHRLGFIGGLNFATVGGGFGDDILNKEDRIGFLAGGYGEIGLHRNIVISPEAYYIMKGVKGTEGGEEFEAKVNFVEIPVLLKAVFPTSAGTVLLRPHAFAGPSVSFQVSCKVEFTVSGVFDCEDPDLEPGVKDVDFGLVFGAGVDIGRFFVGIRTGIGLVDMNDDPSAATDEDIKFETLSLVAGASIPIGRR